MANNKSALKRIRQDVRKSESNRAHVAGMRTAIKNFRNAVETGEGNAQDLFKLAVKEIDSTANKGLIHKNKAARDKSRLSGLLSK